MGCLRLILLRLVIKSVFTDFHFCYFFCSMSVRRQWVREEDLAKELKRNTKELRKLIRHFEEQKFVMRYHRKEVCEETMFFQIDI